MARSTPVARIDVTPARLHALLARVQPTITADDYRELEAVVDTLVHLAEVLSQKNTSLARLRALLFGACTETTRNVLARLGLRRHARASVSSPDRADRPDADGTPPRGHGRYGAEAYTGGHHIWVPHPHLKPGDVCPHCDKGKVYRPEDSHVLVRFVAQAPIGVDVYALDALRCNLCGDVFAAPPPTDVGDEKYAASTGAMIALLKYGTGVPFYRLQQLQASLGIPLPASTQWEIVAAVATRIRPVLNELIRQAANGEVLHNDDTPMRVLSLVRKSCGDPPSESTTQAPAISAAREMAPADDVSPRRTGVFTSGIVAQCGDHRVALFFTGRRHAGENLGTVLAARAPELPPPIQMCDALSRNVPEAYATIVANCLTHARRGAVDVAVNFPVECRYVLEILRDVYAYDAQAREQQLSPAARLAFHQAHSGPLMEALHTWCRAQLDEHRVEPNSSLGEALKYFLKHWVKLTRFLTVPGAPLDNSLVERALKRAILHRKSALFYKTLNGARVGDLFMSAIHTCELNGVNPFAYLIALQQHADALAVTPSAWMPWNYREALRPSEAAWDTG
jgi:transposase